VDSSGYAYVTGGTDSTNFPTTAGAFQTTLNGGAGNAFLTKVNTTGSALVYSTYLGGNSLDQGNGIAVDSSGNAYVVGTAQSSNFPVTPGAFQTTCAGGGDFLNCWDAFVTEMNPSGSALVYSTYLGGSWDDWGYGIAIDSAGNTYVTGTTTSGNFPTLMPLQPSNGGPFESGDAFVAKLSPGGSALIYSTYLGGSGYDQGSGIALDSSGNAYVTGSTSSANFPTANPLQPFLGGGGQSGSDYAETDAFVAKISAEPSDVNLFPLHLDFGTQGNNSISPPQASTLTNAASSSLTITSISIVGADNQSFAQTNTCGTSVPPGASCSVTVTFNSTVSGNRSASVNIASPDSPQLLSLTGVALPPKSFTSTALVSNLNPSVYGQPITFTATVTSTGGTPPNGETVTFYNGLNVLGTAPMTGGIAALTNSSMGSGMHTISAAYLGDANFTGSTSPALEQAVDTSSQSATTTALTSSLNPSIYGQKVTWSATVTTSGKATPTGKVNFNWGSYSIGTTTLNSSGVATLTRSNLAANTYPLFAVYTGDVNNGPSASPILNQVITQATSSATLTSSPNPSTQGQPVTFTAKITSSTTTPTGPVTFTAGKTTLGTVELSNGKATLTTSTLAVGSTTVTVTYPWNSDIAGSAASVTQVVQQ
jgi:Bacterial Ig-like domain (group 3)/Beta-propeller repeat